MVAADFEYEVINTAFDEAELLIKEEEDQKQTHNIESEGLPASMVIVDKSKKPFNIFNY